MNLWVRSQDKESLVIISNIQYILRKEIDCGISTEYHYIGTYYDNLKILGTYKTKERALEVLDEIHKCIIDKEVLHGCNSLLTLINKSTLKNAEEIIDRTEKIAVYEMPEK